MTLSDLKNLMQNSISSAVWIMTPNGNHAQISGSSYKIAVELDYDGAKDDDYLVAIKDRTSGNVCLRATKNKSMDKAVAIFGSYPDGIVLQGNIHTV